MRTWIPAIGAMLWLYIIQGVAGTTASIFSGISMLAVCAIAFWEAGTKDTRP